jgi:hypothetical protein
MKPPTVTRSSSGIAWTARIWLRMMQVVGVLLVFTGLVAVANRAEPQEPFPLDEYPGLGRSPAAALRDDTVAAWETFRREQLIASCMQGSGFAYQPAVAFPPEALAAVAKGLGVRYTGSAVPVSPLGRNDAYVEALSAEARERYYRTLLAESAADVAETRRTGRLPAGRGADFATGGCVGESNAAVPSVWTLKRDLGDELDAARRDMAGSQEIGAASAAYAECAQRAGGISARGPADLDALAASDRSWSEAVAAVTKACTELWVTGYRRAEVAALKQFEQRNAAALLVAGERYRDVMKTISADQAFLTYLSQYATPVVSLNYSSSVIEGDAYTSTVMTFTVSLSHQTSSDVTVEYYTATGSANPYLCPPYHCAWDPYDPNLGFDYRGVYFYNQQTATIPAGALSKTIEIPILGDASSEMDEDFTLWIQNPRNAILGNFASRGTIIDNDRH